MQSRLVKGATLTVIIALSACAGINSEVEPGDSVAKVCEAARALANAPVLADAALAAIQAGDRLAAAYLARRADTERQSAMVLMSSADQLEGHLDPPGSPGYIDRVHEMAAAQQAVDLLVGVLGEPAAQVSVEARPRVLAAARTAVGQIALPEACTTIEVPSPSP